MGAYLGGPHRQLLPLGRANVRPPKLLGGGATNKRLPGLAADNPLLPGLNIPHRQRTNTLARAHPPLHPPPLHLHERPEAMPDKALFTISDTVKCQACFSCREPKAARGEAERTSTQATNISANRNAKTPVYQAARRVLALHR